MARGRGLRATTSLPAFVLPEAPYAVKLAWPTCPYRPRLGPKLDLYAIEMFRYKLQVAACKVSGAAFRVTVANGGPTRAPSLSPFPP